MSRIIRPHGYATVTSRDDGRLMSEQDTMQCCHCNGSIFIDPDPTKREETYGCQRCNDVVCGPCHGVGTCRPFEQWLEKVEKRARRSSVLEACGIAD